MSKICFNRIYIVQTYLTFARLCHPSHFLLVVLTIVLAQIITEQLLVTIDTSGVCADDLPIYVQRFYGQNSREIHVHAIIKCLVSIFY